MTPPCGAELTRRLGVEFDQVDRNGQADIAGVPHELIERFSARRRQVLAGGAERIAQTENLLGRPLSDGERAEQYQRAALDRRPGKAHGAETEAELRARWQTEAPEIGHPAAAWLTGTLDRTTNANRSLPNVDPQLVADTVAALTEQHARVRAGRCRQAPGPGRARPLGKRRGGSALAGNSDRHGAARCPSRDPGPPIPVGDAGRAAPGRRAVHRRAARSAPLDHLTDLLGHPGHDLPTETWASLAGRIEGYRERWRLTPDQLGPAHVTSRAQDQHWHNLELVLPEPAIAQLDPPAPVIEGPASISACDHGSGSGTAISVGTLDSSRVLQEVSASRAFPDGWRWRGGSAAGLGQEHARAT